jgi:hypothetical protein
MDWINVARNKYPTCSTKNIITAEEPKIMATIVTVTERVKYNIWLRGGETNSLV